LGSAFYSRHQTTSKRLTRPAQQLFAHCWDRLCAAVGERDNPWRTPALASTSSDGPEVRTVVLRAALQDTAGLEFHTDCRSPKAWQLNACPEVAWLFWDSSTREQLRCRGPVEMHQGDAAAMAAWKQLHRSSRTPYLQPTEPGETWEETDLTLDDEAAFKNFLLVRCTVRHMDWLRLDKEQHLRVEICLTDTGWVTRRIAP